MTGDALKILSVGASGSIGRFVIARAIREGHTVRALVRDTNRLQKAPPGVEIFVGDLSKPESLKGVTTGIDAIIFTHGADGGRATSEDVDYGGVRNVLLDLGSNTARIALMTAIGVTNRTGSYNRQTQAHDWKRRGERLVRASGLEYTIVRPGWFDYNAPDEQHLVMLQGDKRQAGNSSDGVIARRQIAEVLVRSLSSKNALRKTFEVVAERGSAQVEFESLFASLKPDPVEGLDGIEDSANQPLADEPERVRHDWEATVARKLSRG